MDKYRISYSLDNFGEITVIGNGLKIKELIEEGNPVNRIEFVRNTPDRKKEMEMMMYILYQSSLCMFLPKLLFYSTYRIPFLIGLMCRY